MFRAADVHHHNSICPGCSSIRTVSGDISEQEERPFISRNQTIAGSVAQICRYFTMAVFYGMAIKVIKQKVNTSKSINLVVKD